MEVLIFIKHLWGGMGSENPKNQSNHRVGAAVSADHVVGLL